MKRIFSIFAIMAGVVLVAAPSSVYATCNGIPQALQHGFGSFFTQCPDLNPVSMYAYVLGLGPTVNSNGIAFDCESAAQTTQQLIACQPEAGVPGDGNVTVQFDWGGIGPVLGCPNPTLAPNTGRNVLQVVANDGSSILLSINFEGGTQTYMVETAQQSDAAGNVTPLACGFGNGPGLASSSAGVTPSLSNVCVNVPTPHVNSDCDAGTLGQLLGSCLDTTPAATPGNVYTRNAPCGTSPDSRISNGWTQVTTVAGPGGSRCFPLAKPAATTPPTCTFVGTSAIVGSVETNITGSFRVGDANAASPKAHIDKAVLAEGKLVVDFSTSSELGAVGFNVLAGGRLLNTNLIAATGVGGGGSKYHFEIGRGVLKNDRSITVQTKLNDGGVVLSDAATLSK